MKIQYNSSSESEEDEEEEELSSYELLRLKNVENNRQYLMSLGLLNDFSESPVLQKPPAKQKRKRHSRSPVPPTRPKSQRIQELKKKGILDTPPFDLNQWHIPMPRKNRIRLENTDYSKMNGTSGKAMDLKRKDNTAFHLKGTGAGQKQETKVFLGKGQMPLFPSKKAVLFVLIIVLVAMVYLQDSTELYRTQVLLNIIYLIIGWFFLRLVIIFYFYK